MSNALFTPIQTNARKALSESRLFRRCCGAMPTRRLQKASKTSKYRRFCCLPPAHFRMLKPARSGLLRGKCSGRKVEGQISGASSDVNVAWNGAKIRHFLPVRLNMVVAGPNSAAFIMPVNGLEGVNLI
ncbi:hypothetical protein AAIB41_08800 [Brucella sp. BE17]|uniref:hypothetical protein n=1 Tax=Brucella sp. BE17 TaxID=3142977 RepID=UPI0031BBC261